MIFKIFSVLSHDAHDVYNDNIDLRVIMEDERVSLVRLLLELMWRSL